VLAIEYLAACQGIDFLRPLKTTQPLEAVHSLLRSKVPHLDRDRVMSVDIDAAVELVSNATILSTVAPFFHVTNPQENEVDVNFVTK